MNSDNAYYLQLLNPAALPETEDEKTALQKKRVFLAIALSSVSSSSTLCTIHMLLWYLTNSSKIHYYEAAQQIFWYLSHAADDGIYYK